MKNSTSTERENYYKNHCNPANWKKSNDRMEACRAIAIALMNLLLQQMMETLGPSLNQGLERSIGMKSIPETNICPVCGKAMLEYMEVCPVCEWQNDLSQIRHPDWKNCANQMSLEQAKVAYARGKEVK